MILPIVEYGHPALRAKGSPVQTISPEIRKLIDDMLETMYHADGVGLAAQQVGRPLQLCVIDVSAAVDRPSRMWISGKMVDPKKFMPLILINPSISTSGPAEHGTEGCLSFPGISASIPRPRRVSVKAISQLSQPIHFEAEGLLARAVLHEHDHLKGVLFIDHMSAQDRQRHAPALASLLAKNGNCA